MVKITLEVPEELSEKLGKLGDRLIDLIIAEKHGGLTVEDNLAYTCWRCNRYKGTDLGSFDPVTDRFCFLFHPRSQQWQEHFKLQDNEIIGITSEGRTTTQLLKLNSEERIVERSRIYAD